MLTKKLLKSILLFALLSFPLLCKAEFCPTALELQAGNYNEWKLLNIDDASPLSDEDTKNFQNKVQSFALAEWMSAAPEGSGHCYYWGDIPDPNYLGAFLAKDGLKPLSPAWEYVNENVMQCTAGAGVCLFESS